MSDDDELIAMSKIQALVSPLDADARGRVLAWIVSKFGDHQNRNMSVSMRENLSDTPLGPVGSLAEYFSKASGGIKTDADRVLVAATFLQENEGLTELTGLEINRELHHLGHRVNNVTKAISALMDKKPQMMIQTRKEGTTRQAKKKYRVTIEGQKAVRDLISGGQST